MTDEPSGEQALDAARAGEGLDVERLALAIHKTRLNNDSDEYDMGRARRRAERVLAALHPDTAAPTTPSPIAPDGN